jgi:signal transduction histidine kinase
MKSPLHILHLADDPHDVVLVEPVLKAEGINCEVTRVKCQDDFMAALERNGIDLILSDYSLPGFDGLSALKVAHSTRPDIPLIFLSGTLGEERAVDSLKSGATDYVLKGHLNRLVPAVRRAMQDVEDRAERCRLKAQFIEAQKMEVIGHLASGVAHDFNNILGVIMGYSDLMTSELEPDSPLRKYTDEIRHASECAIGLTQQLLVFSRKQTVQTVVLDLNEVVVNLDKMLRRLIGENIVLTIVPGKEIGCIKADSGYIGQVLMNLVVNARDAMPNGGKLKVETANAMFDENQAREHAGAIPGDYVMLSVSDTGIGMTDEVKTHIFESFFTTKPKGKGTGLGLATCQTIVKQCGGCIDIQSEPGKGSTFKIYFPRVKQSIDMPTKTVESNVIPRGTETLLLVEDEPSVRHLACRILEAQGYNVLHANNGQDGLRVARECKDSLISLVITDVVMPQMSGKVMAEWLKATYPELKVLFTSGYTDEAIAEHGVLEPGTAFLPKPYQPAVLLRKVREILDNETETNFLRKQKMTVNQS